ncbi:D-alanyl-D-alanine carboxypeptidase/D-alanyl-D-alanine-endopeptidase [Leptolyngbya sp. 'hensonii']|nr:D-alanyl-D-alanine carboxypeptidase/D-alanyl-D-alanine-endopeptidase [Leptolyngbya sp. 'hensonii']
MGFLPVLMLILWIRLPMMAQPVSQRLCSAGLGAAIEAIIDRPSLARAHWGILVQTLAAAPSARRTLYARSAQQYFIPASTAKLLTTAAALQTLGPQFRIRTSVYRMDLADQVILRVVGRGDPSLSRKDLQELAHQVQQQGIRQVDRLLADDRYFRGDPIHPNWEWEDIQSGYGAPVNSLILNQNAIGLELFPQAVGQPLQVKWEDAEAAIGWTIENTSITVGPSEPEFVEVGRDVRRPILRVRGQLRVGSAPDSAAVAVLDPAEVFLKQFQKALVAQQIQVRQASLDRTVEPGKQQEVGAIESPPLMALIQEINQTSNNLYAEAILRTLGTVDNPEDSSLSIGLQRMKTTLTRLGVNPSGYDLADGSGLSRHSLASPEALVQTLQAMASVSAYRASLPTTATAGSLQRRFEDLPVQTIVQAKPGTMTGVVALAGYLSNPDFQPLAFSLIVNQSPLPVRELRQAIDDLVKVMARLQSC